MRYWFMVTLVLGAGWVGGCASTQPSEAPFPTTPTVSPFESPLIVTPDLEASGRIALVKPNSGYVIVSFPVGALPPPRTRMHVYRSGLKVGEVVTGDLQLDFKVVADIVAGSCQIGDEVRLH